MIEWNGVDTRPGRDLPGVARLPKVQKIGTAMGGGDSPNVAGVGGKEGKERTLMPGHGVERRGRGHAPPGAPPRQGPEGPAQREDQEKEERGQENNRRRPPRLFRRTAALMPVHGGTPKAVPIRRLCWCWCAHGRGKSWCAGRAGTHRGGTTRWPGPAVDCQAQFLTFPLIAAHRPLIRSAGARVRGCA